MMKHKQLLSLICAAGVVLASVPALPVIAAETAPVSTAADGQDYRQEGRTEDDAYWTCTNAGGIGKVEHTAGKNGSFTFSWKDTADAYFTMYNLSDRIYEEQLQNWTYSYTGELDLGDSGYYGIGMYPYLSTKLNFIEGWAENSNIRENAGEKIGEITDNGETYDVYRKDKPTEDGTNEPDYWIIPRTNRYDPAAHRITKGAAPVGRLLTKLESAGVDKMYLLFRDVHLFVQSGKSESGKASGSAKFAYSTFGFNHGIYDGEDGARTDDGYGWYTRSNYNIGKTEYTVGESGSFSFKWNDVEWAHFLLTLPKGKGWETPASEALGKALLYQGELDLGEDGLFGAYTSWGTVFVYIVEGHGEKSDNWGDSDKQIGEIRVGNVYYDVYETSHIGTTGEEYPYYWCVRRDNQYYGPGSVVHNAVPVPLIFRELSKLENVVIKWDPTMSISADLLVDTGQSATEMVSGSAVFSKVEFSEPGTWFTETGTKDGYQWGRIQKAYEFNTSMTAGDKGAFKAEWKDLLPSVSTLFVSGREYNNISLDEVQSIDCAYEVKRTDAPNSSSGYWNYGFVSTFADLSGEIPVLTECYFRESDSVSDLFDPKQKFGEFEINDICYRVYILPVNEETKDTLPVASRQFTKQQCWIERWWDMHNGSITISDTCSVDLLQIFKVVEKLGIKLDGALTDISFYALADYGTDSLEVLKNEISLVKEGAISPEPNIRGDANCDGALDVSDAVLASRVLVEDAEAKISDQGLLNADIDLSGKLDPADITLMLQVISKKVTL